MHRRLVLGLLAGVLAVQIACVDLTKAGGGDTALYVFNVESNTAKIQVFTDLNAVYTDTGDPAVSKTLTSSLLSKVTPLGWGGLVLDSQGNNLYAVGEYGTVIRVDRLRSQSGAISANDAVSFTLGSSSDRLSNGKFGQAAFDSNTRTLFVQEANEGGDTQIWAVSSPASIAAGATVTKNLLTLTPGDKFGWGVAAGGGTAYGFFQEGNRLDLVDSWTGPRLRKSTGSSFPLFGSVLGGDKTTLGIYGSMALDTGNNLLYFARHNKASGVDGTPAPILVFNVGQLAGASNQAPDHLLGNGTDMGNLRVLSHGGNKDWLVALTSESGAPVNVFWLWKDPKTADAPVKRTLSGSGIRGVAFDGSN